MIKKQKPLPPIEKEEEPFEIPSSWEWVRLGEVSKDITYGYNASAQNTGQIKFLRITDIQNNNVQWENVPYCDIENNKLSKLKLENKDILIARTGGTIGKSFLIQNIDIESVFASYLLRVQLVNTKIATYVYTFLQSSLYWYFLRKISQGSGQPNVNSTNLKNILIPLPPLSEQQRIVSKIEELLAELDKIDKAQKTYDSAANKLRDKVLDCAMRGKLVSQDPSDEPASELLRRIEKEKENLIKNKMISKSSIKNIVENSTLSNLPRNWISTSLQNIAYIQNGKSLKSISNKGNDICLYCKISDMNNNYLYIEKTNEIVYSSKNKYAVHTPAIIFPKVGGALSTNKRRIVKKDNVIIDSNTGAIIPIIHSIFNWIYLWLYQLDMTDISSGSVLPKVGNKELYPLMISIPPIKEQIRIIDKVKLIFDFL